MTGSSPAYPQPDMPGVEQALVEVRARLTGSTPCFLRVRGRAGAGSTTVLHRLREELRKDDVPVALVAGAHGLDGASVAMLDIVDEFDLDAELYRRLDITFEHKLDALEGELRRLTGLVLLLDELASWGQQDTDDLHASALHGEMLRTMLLDRSGAHVVFTGAGVTARRWYDDIEVDMRFRHDDFLAQLGEHVQLRDSAHALRQLDDVGSLSGALLRAALLLDHLYAGDTRARKRLRRDLERDAYTLHDLGRELERALRDGSPQIDAMGLVWDMFSTVRIPIEEEVASAIFATAGADAATADLLRTTLLFQRESGVWDMHGQLKQARRIQLADRGAMARREVHHAVAAAYVPALGNLTSPDSRALLRRSAEAYYHLAHAGSTADAVRPYFVDQLKLHGRARSLEGREFWERARGRMDTAARVEFTLARELFSEALEHAPDDSYALHYRGYNRDVVGDDPLGAEQDYRAAIVLDPESIWWRSRLVTHLLARGRRADARHEWARAIDACAEFGSEWLTRHLHRWALRWALHFADLEFCEQIRDASRSRGLDPDMRAQFEAMYRVLDRMHAASNEEDVLPRGIDPDHLGTRTLLLGDRDLACWYNARVQAREVDRVVLRLAGPFEPGLHNDVSRLQTIVMTVEDLVAQSIDTLDARRILPGRFLELGERSEGIRVLKFFDVDAWTEPGIPPLFPDPERYLDGWAPDR